MSELRSPDGKYLYVIQGDQNEVVYDAATMTPLWDRWTHEAGLPSAPIYPPPSLPDHPAEPEPPTPQPIPSQPARPGQVVKVADGPFHPRFYSYWPNAYQHDGTIYVFAGSQASGPVFFAVSGVSAEGLGARVPYLGTTEGWYWSTQGYVYLTDGPRLRRVNPFNGHDEVVMDISSVMPGHQLWQAHSSDDGQVHSATVQQTSGSWAKVATVVIYRGDLRLFQARGHLDESQVDKSGRWLIIKEDDDNRIVDLETKHERFISNRDGALGHSDCGSGFAVGENDQIGACVYLDLVTLSQRPLFSTWNMGHVSVRGDRCLLSNNEILGLVNLQTGDVQELVRHGGGGGGYDAQVRANLSPDGGVACYMVNGAVYLLVIP